jgi:hypothetical protein
MQEQNQAGQTPETALVPIRSIHPAPENDDIYGAVSTNDPDVLELVKSIQAHGIQEPLLISDDNYIISGHRRFHAACVCGLKEIPVRRHPICRFRDSAGFIKLLVEMNTQRVKSTPVTIRETLVKIDPKEAHKKIVNEREEKDEARIFRSSLESIDPLDDGMRSEISPAKYPLLRAVQAIIGRYREYWPLTVRQIHYLLLGPDAPLKHASKPDSVYLNTEQSYKKALVHIVARGRIEGYIPWEAIDDSTRTLDRNNAFWNTGSFFRQEFKNFLQGYWRDRQQSPPNDIVLIAEKLTLRTILHGVARQYCIPFGVARGQTALVLKHKIVQRFRKTKKDNLILLLVSDLDPAGDTIAEDWVKSIRRDFGVKNIEGYKVALTVNQIEEYGLQPSMEAKKKSPTYGKFVERYDMTSAYEVEAMKPDDLQQVLRNALNHVMDLDAYNSELGAEEKDSAECSSPAAGCGVLQLTGVSVTVPPELTHLPH